jgi:hypothetical protein
VCQWRRRCGGDNSGEAGSEEREDVVDDGVENTVFNGSDARREVATQEQTQKGTVAVGATAAAVNGKATHKSHERKQIFLFWTAMNTSGSVIVADSKSNKDILLLKNPR